jgi:phosphatidylserine/phosphatidylglycerophosphate/cardiolipin synthase-like enzyme
MDQAARASLVYALALAAVFIAAPACAAEIQACFSPPLPGGCDPRATVVQTIDGARKTVLVQVYALTSRQIVSALVNAKHGGVEVRAIVDRSQFREDRSDTYAVGRLASGGVPVLVDTVPGLMHNKVMIVDGATVVTGSSNYTWSAEHRNAENLFVINNPAGKELPMNAREQLLRERCAKFGALISRLDLRALTKRQRQVAKLRMAGLSLQVIGKRLGVSGERVRQIEARLRTRARLFARRESA